MGITSLKTTAGGVSFTATRREMIRACVHLRTAHRILWSIAHFEARTPDALYDEARRRVRWGDLVPEDRTISVYATCRDSEIRHSRFAALRIKDAIVDTLREQRGHRPSVDREDADIPIRARIARDQVTLSVDAAGQSLSRRGYRLDAGPAPLRESLAAALVLLSRWKGDRPLIDPMCGSGTIPIEASLIARAAAPGLSGRRYAFERWPGHRPALLEDIRTQAEAAVEPCESMILGSDISAREITKARDNHARAHPMTPITWRTGDLAALENPTPGGPAGVIICNPPYGERLSEAKEVAALHRMLGQKLRAGFSGWDCWMLISAKELESEVGLQVARRFPVKNGPLDITITHFIVP